MDWQLLPKGYVDPPKPDWVTAAEQAVAACPGHVWLLVLEDNGEVDLSCERCPAGVDDLYPDGHDMIFYSADGIEVEMGHHNLPDDDTPVRIPVTAHVLSGRDYWGDYEVELIIEARDSHEAPSPVSDSS